MLKIVGVVFVVVSCGTVGFRLADNHRREEQYLRQLVRILDFIACELQYRLTPLPTVCVQVSREFPAKIGNVFACLEQEMRRQILPDMARCMEFTLNKVQDLPPITRKCLRLLGASIGRFDIEGQLKGLEAVRQECKRNLEDLAKNRDTRIRGYQTLGLCAGAAIAILLV